MTSFFQKILDTVFNSWVEGSIQLILQVIGSVSQSAVVILDMPVVINAILYTQTVSTSLLVLFILYRAIYTNILRMNGDSDADPIGLIKGSIQAVAMIWCAPWLIRYVYKIGSQMAYDFTNLGGNNMNTQGNLIQVLFKAMSSGSAIELFIFIASIITLVTLLIVIIQTSIRAGELAITAIAGPLMSVTLVNGPGIFSNWWRDVLAISLSQASQILLLKIAFEILRGMLNSPTTWIIPFTSFIGVLIVAIKSPSTIKNWMYSSGVGRMGSGAAQSGIQALMMKMAKK